MTGEEFELEAIRAVAVLEAGPDVRRRADARSALMSAIDGATAAPGSLGHAQPKSQRRPAFPRRWSIGAVSGLATAAAAAVLVMSHGGAVQPASAVAAVLDHAADAPPLVSPLHLHSDQVWYSEQVRNQEIARSPKTCTSDCYETRVIRWWVGPRRYSMRMYVTAHSAKRQTVTQVPPNVPLTNPTCCSTAHGAGYGYGYDTLLTYKRMLLVSTSVSSLRWLMWHAPGTDATGPMPHWEIEQRIFESIQTVLSSPRVPARMLSGLYRLLATMPGATLRRSVTDTLGRRAVEIEYRVPVDPKFHDVDLRVALLFDPRSYVLLDTIERWNGTDKFPAYYGDTAYVNSGIVHRIGALPAGQAEQR